MICLECGLEFKPKRKGEFCGRPCYQAWTNRRLQRGAILYDLFMAVRHDRAEATKAQAWTIMCNCARAFADGDQARRGGRRSWVQLKDALARLPLAYGEDGDKL